MPLPESWERADPEGFAPFDDVIDVRSPAEFAEDHVPGAINLPVLDNEERARVGTIYVQESAFLARRMGAALVARNVARHLETALADRPQTYRPLIYCWRGGQRSNAMALILGQIGWRAAVLKGGYKTYRRRVQARLYDVALGFDLVLLDGGTGAGKTEVLKALARRGVQTLDLEAMAEHRGSLFGGRAGAEQPSQKTFETRLAAALDRLDPARPLVVEAESSKVGDRIVPPALWRAMAQAPRVLLTAPREARARHLIETYGELVADPAALKHTLSQLPVHIGRKAVEAMAAQVDAGAFTELAASLMELHYDPAYSRSAREDQRPLLGSIALEHIDDAGVEDAATTIQTMLVARRGRSTPS
jgi:tRNA 2-selenouridine synthase